METYEPFIPTELTSMPSDFHHESTLYVYVHVYLYSIIKFGQDI